jgi:hypothetical protein
MTETVQQIQKYMGELGWSNVDLHRVTLISLQNLDDIMQGIKPPTHIQLMIIVNKITKQYPSEQHWGIYHSIVIKPTMTEDKRK